jgi:hypothetical protein
MMRSLRDSLQTRIAARLEAKVSFPHPTDIPSSIRYPIMSLDWHFPLGVCII